MRVNFKFILVLIPTLLLFSCKQENRTSYDYFMQHPQQIQVFLGNCESSTTPECENARRADHDFQQLTSDRDANAQEFGKKILAAENDLVQKQLELDTAKKSLKAEPKNSALQAKVATLEDGYQSNLNNVKTYLAVVAAGGSPQ